MTDRTASCRCGQFTALAEGDPLRVSVCHCLACQKRTGSAFAAQARWSAECVSVEGNYKEWVRTADSGQKATYHFCPDCGSTLYYVCSGEPDIVAIPLGALDDPYVSGVDYSVYEERKHDWVEVEAVDHYD